MPSEPILEIEGLHVSYGGIRALDGFEMTVPANTVSAFVGSNGAGKTTTFSTIAGFVRPRAGTIRIQGELLDDFRKKGGRIGLLPQDVSFFEDRTLFSQLFFLARLSGMPRSRAQSEVEWALEAVGLSNRRRCIPLELSRGMKVQLGIAQAILGHPSLVLLDEPTAGLDPLKRALFYELVNRLKREITFVISSHQLSELETLCDRVCIIEKGKRVVEDSMENILETGRHMRFRLACETLPEETFRKRFPALAFSFDSSRRVLSIRLPGESADEPVRLGREILTWLMEYNIGIMEMTQKSSLSQRYLEKLEHGSRAHGGN
jgi:ABC-type multidrug transport system ATPase subunit